MGRIIRICKVGVALSILATPNLASAKQDDAVNQYASARLAELGNFDGDALKTYIKLGRDAPDSTVLADRIFQSAFRSGNMVAALRAARTQQLRGNVSGEATLLFFADAFKQKKWVVAERTAEELSERGNFGFLVPILQAWINLAQGNAADIDDDKYQSDPLFGFYSNDQRIYLDLASGQMGKAKLGLRAMAGIGDDYVRDLMLRAAPVIAGQGDDVFADALIGTALGPDRGMAALLPAENKRKSKFSAEDGLAALHVRIADALLQQNANDQALVLARIAAWYSPENEPAKLMLAKALLAQALDAQSLVLAESISPTSFYWSEAIKLRLAGLPADDAMKLSRAAALRWPQSPRLALLAAQTQEAAGDLAGAVDSYRKLRDFAANDGTSPRQRAYYHLLLASALDNSGDWTGASKELELASVLDPNNAQILNYWGYSLIDRNEELPRGTAMIRKAFQISPGSAAITDSLGWALFRTGDYAQAVELLEQAAKKSGSDLTINEHLGDAYWQSGRLRDARYAWTVASQTAEGEAATRLASKIGFGLSPR